MTDRTQTPTTDSWIDAYNQSAADHRAWLDARADENAALRREIENYRRALWALARQAGGEITLSAHAMFDWRSTARLEVWMSPDGMSQQIRAVSGT